MGRWARRVLEGPRRPRSTDRGKNGVNRSILVEADGGPLSVIVTGANVPDFKLLGATLDAVIIERPEPLEESPQHLCLDKGYDKGEVAEQAVEARGYTPPYKAHRRGEARLSAGEKRYPARRWVG
ncbi:MAG: transposase [Actinomycetota bacterium]|nr:transposase [Actinomycetota bacterium]